MTTPFLVRSIYPARLLVATALCLVLCIIGSPSVTAQASVAGPTYQDAPYSQNTITRIAIPSIKVDRVVEQVGPVIQQRAGVDVAVWQVSKYNVGHHLGTANPGDGDNIVLAGHSGGTKYPFNDIFYLQAGSKLYLWSAGQRWSYTVATMNVVEEANASAEQRRENYRFIEPTDGEVVTLVTCWPLSDTKTAKKFTQRVIVRAVPDRRVAAHVPTQHRTYLPLVVR